MNNLRTMESQCLHFFLFSLIVFELLFIVLILQCLNEQFENHGVSVSFLLFSLIVFEEYV